MKTDIENTESAAGADSSLSPCSADFFEELSEALRILGAKSDLLGTIGSVGETISDKEAVECLRAWNRANGLGLAASAGSASIALTPRTDAELSYRPGDYEDGITPWVRAKVAWDIERDFNAAKYALEDARELLAEICRGEVNPEDEAEKWLRAFGWPNAKGEAQPPAKKL
jgi:hypothetical protein